MNSQYLRKKEELTCFVSKKVIIITKNQTLLFY